VNGERIEQLRKKRGLTQRELADMVEVSERTYQLWRSGRPEPYGKHRKKLAEALRIPVSELMDESAKTMGALERIEDKQDRMGEKLDRLLAHLRA
jgi:transcriptional regulator with XRE-family HTH domain